MDDPSSSTRIAVLIDCDNVSAKHTAAVLEELAKYGTPTVKRAYGDWTTSQLGGWKPELHRNAIQPVQQFAYTVGKNSTDSALIIDAMDLLWQGNVEAFALVSSDSDFTRLATRLHDSGQDEGRSPSPAEDGGEPETTINLQSALTKAINATSGDDGWSALGLVGQHLSRAHADFDPRTFGHQKLSSLVEEQPYLETRAEGSQRQVRLRTRARKTAPASRSAKKATTTKTTSGRSAASTD